MYILYITRAELISDELLLVVSCFCLV